MKTSFKDIEQALRETNALIDAMLEVVRPDFAAVTERLKALGDVPSASAVAKSYGAVVHELQYYDTLTQKMTHIVEIHDLIVTSASETPTNAKCVSGVNLIRLNHIQFQLGCFEYLSSVNEIETNLKVLLQHFGAPDENYRFQHSSLLLSASRVINKNFALLEQLVREHSEANLHGKVEIINTIYSMESERYVLRAYLNKPLLGDAEIGPLHTSSKEKSEIELF